MAGIRGMDDYFASVKQTIRFQKTAISCSTASTYSLWSVVGMPSGGAMPSSTALSVCSKATTGAIEFVSAASGQITELVAASASCSAIGGQMLVDRLLHCAGLDASITSTQTVGGAALTRHTDGVGISIAVEVYTAIGGTSTNIQAVYTNSDGVGGRITPSAQIVGGSTAGRMYPLPLQSGDKGVRSVESVTLSASSGAAGNFGITLFQTVAMWPITVVGAPWQSDFTALGLPSVHDDACLSIVATTGTTTTGTLMGVLTLGQI